MSKHIAFILFISLIILIIVILKLRYSIIVDSLEKRLDYKLPVVNISLLPFNDRIIWSYWNDTNLPIAVRIAIHTWKKWNPEYTICLVNKDNLTEYIDINTFPKKFKELSHQHKADVIRLALLEKYGGIWIDSTIFLHEPLSLTWDNNYDLGGYFADIFTTKEDKPVFENWFISAPKQSKLISEWKKEFYRAVDYPNPQQYIDELEKEIDCQKINGKVYLMMHCVFLKIIDKTEYKFKFFSASNGPFEYLVKHDWNSIKAVEYLLTTKTSHIQPVIKLRGCERVIYQKLFDIMKEGSICDQIIG